MQSREDLANNRYWFFQIQTATGKRYFLGFNACVCVGCSDRDYFLKVIFWHSSGLVLQSWWLLICQIKRFAHDDYTVGTVAILLSFFHSTVPFDSDQDIHNDFTMSTTAASIFAKLVKVMTSAKSSFAKPFPLSPVKSINSCIGSEMTSQKDTVLVRVKGGGVY